eukprot:362896-Chlamydomonas_euryale.AAC.5
MVAIVSRGTCATAVMCAPIGRNTSRLQLGAASPVNGLVFRVTAAGTLLQSEDEAANPARETEAHITLDPPGPLALVGYEAFFIKHKMRGCTDSKCMCVYKCACYRHPLQSHRLGTCQSRTEWSDVQVTITDTSQALPHPFMRKVVTLTNVHHFPSFS